MSWWLAVTVENGTQCVTVGVPGWAAVTAIAIAAAPRLALRLLDRRSEG